MKISRHAIRMAGILTDALKSRGYEFFAPPQTNQIFVVLDNDTLARLKRHATFSVWQKLDSGRTSVRFVTSWATGEGDVNALIALL